jgi:lactate permease
METWTQNYDPLGNIFVSAAIAAIPAVLLLVLIAGFNVRIHLAACVAFIACLAVALGFYRMPLITVGATSVYGAAFGLFPIGWLILNTLFVYQLTVQKGLFDVLRDSLAKVAPDPRIQLILIAFAFGSFLEGMAGFGAPVAITAAILIQLRFKPLHASGLALVANTAPVAFGSLGIPLTTLEQVTGLDVRMLSATVGAQLAGFSFLIPFLISVMFGGWRGLLGIWPAAFVAGLAYAVPQFLISTYHGPWLTAPASAVSAIVALVLLLRVWRPRELWSFNEKGELGVTTEAQIDKNLAHDSRKKIVEAWTPWIILTLLIFIWGVPQFQTMLDKFSQVKIPMPYLHHLVQRVPPLVADGAPAETAVFKLNFLSSTGTGIILAAGIIAFLIGTSARDFVRIYGETFWRIRLSLLTIVLMLALGNLTRYSGSDGTLGLALAHTSHFYPFFGTFLGWIGAAVTGSDTSSNVLFGSMQKITAQQVGINPVLMCAANTSGGVMGKMISSQSIVVASTATNWYGHEGSILRYVFIPSIVLTLLMGILVYLEAYVVPFTLMVSK